MIKKTPEQEGKEAKQAINDMLKEAEEKNIENPKKEEPRSIQDLQFKDN